MLYVSSKAIHIHELKSRPVSQRVAVSPLNQPRPKPSQDQTLYTHLWLFVALIIGFGCPEKALASSMEVFGFGARGMATTGAQTSATQDFHAVHYNPSRIVARPGSKAGIGTQLFLYDLDFERAKQDSPYATLQPESNVGIHFGGSTTFGGFFKDRLGAAFLFYAPLAQGTRLEQRDPRMPQSYMYQTLPDKMVSSFALAGALTSWLNIGFGAQMLASVSGIGETSVFLEQSRVVKRSFGVDFSHNIVPTAGLSIDLSEKSVFGVAYRAAVGGPYTLPITVELIDLGTIEWTSEGTAVWDPDCIDFGLSQRIPELDLSLFFTLSYALWSRAPAPNSIVSVNYSDPYQAEGEEPLLYVSSDPINLGASDILIPRLGLEWNPTEPWSFMGGYAYRPTPLPRASKAATYLDGNTHILGLGAEYRSEGNEKDNPLPLTLGIAAQWHHIMPRTSEKEDPLGPTGSVRFLGNSFSLLLELSHDL